METKDEDGNTVRFGSVGGGGRYDDLVARFTGQQVPATGFSIGVSRLYSALKLVGKARDVEDACASRRAGHGQGAARRLLALCAAAS